ncbi:hypothetical protein R1flu_005200 [Riccia fluitans]|uniref:Serine/threonine-protein kinase 19 n=1 Tax=Riccia fluitans TaxID=41844 RepID=A0ABD1YSG9_9MARC
MRKKAPFAGASHTAGLAFSKLAASLIKEEKKEERKRKRQQSNRDDDDLVRDGDGKDALEGGDREFVGKKRAIAGDAEEILDGLQEISQGNGPGNCLYSEEDSGLGAPELELGWSLPKDTLVAVRLMCAQFPKIDQSSVMPFVLRSQLYSSVSNRTNADRELEELKQQQVLRVFKLNSGKDDFAVMLKDDYLKQIKGAKQWIQSTRPEEDIAVFDWFRTRVINAHTGTSIRHSQLVLLLSQAGDVKDKQISLLINSGLLVRQLADDSTYWFGIPNVGSLLKSLTQGRKELISFLSRRRYKEMIQAVLEKKRLRTSQFDMRFHIRDLLGSGHIHIVNTPVGPFIRLSSD